MAWVVGPSLPRFLGPVIFRRPACGTCFFALALGSSLPLWHHYGSSSWRTFYVAYYTYSHFSFFGPRFSVSFHGGLFPLLFRAFAGLSGYAPRFASGVGLGFRLLLFPSFGRFSFFRFDVVFVSVARRFSPFVHALRVGGGTVAVFIVSGLLYASRWSPHSSSFPYFAVQFQSTSDNGFYQYLAGGGLALPANSVRPRAPQVHPKSFSLSLWLSVRGFLPPGLGPCRSFASGLVGRYGGLPSPVPSPGPLQRALAFCMGAWGALGCVLSLGNVPRRGGSHPAGQRGILRIAWGAAGGAAALDTCSSLGAAASLRLVGRGQGSPRCAPLRESFWFGGAATVAPWGPAIIRFCPGPSFLRDGQWGGDLTRH